MINKNQAFAVSIITFLVTSVIPYAPFLLLQMKYAAKPPPIARTATTPAVIPIIIANGGPPSSFFVHLNI